MDSGTIIHVLHEGYLISSQGSMPNWNSYNSETRVLVEDYSIMTRYGQLLF